MAPGDETRGWRGLIRAVRDDALYSGSLLLLANAVLLAAFGFVFWAIAARVHSAASVGFFSGVSSAVTLLAAVAALGLPNTMLRHLAGAPHQRGVLAAALASLLALGSGLCLAVVGLLGPHLPADLQLENPAGGTGLLVALVAVTAANALTDAGLVALRATRAVLLKNLAGSIAKLATIAPLAGLDTKGLVLAFGSGAALSAVLGTVLLWRRFSAGGSAREAVRALRRYVSFSLGNYAGMVMGILPLTVVPLIVLGARGPREAAWFTVAYLIVGFVNFIPSTTSQVLFAELSRSPEALRDQVLKALAGIYGLLLPVSLLLLAAGPLVLRIFGADYSAGAGDCLRLLAAGTVFTGANYLIDVLLTSADRVRAYALMNGINAALVLTAVAVLAPEGLTAVGLGWTLAQGASLVAGMVVLAATGVLRPHELMRLHTRASG